MPDYDYDLVVSVASEDRAVAEPYARRLAECGYSVFYNLWQQDNLLGKELLQYLDFIYRSAARHCLIFISKNYVGKAWTNFELRSAVSRAAGEDYEYILPLRIDDTPLPGLDSSIGYLDLRTSSLDRVVSILRKKIGSATRHISLREALQSADKERRLTALSEIWVNRDRAYLDDVTDLLRADPDAEIRARSAWVLDNLRDLATKDFLLEALNDRDRNVRSNAGWALVRLGRDVAEDVKRVLTLTKNDETREMAELVLQRI